LFPSRQAAQDCKAFATSPARGEEDRLLADQVSIRKFIIADVEVFAVFFPAASTGVVHGFWVNAGVGISSRLAEHCLKHLDQLREVEQQQHEESPSPKSRSNDDAPAHLQLKERIAGLLNRAPIDPSCRRKEAKVSPGDVYLYQTGMAGIYWVHRYFLGKYSSPSVLFGFAFHSTIHVLEDFGPGVEFFGLGSTEDLDRLEAFLRSQQQQQQKKTQAIWAEFPSNPLLVTPDLGRLRQLADEHDVLLVVDETVAGFCNVDVLGAADVVVSSLTKSFSGYADVMAASAVLNPASSRYRELKELFENHYHNDLFAGDAEALEHNSRDYIPRSAILNRNAENLVEYLERQASDPSSTVKTVYYPTTNDSSRANYRAYMRPATEEFEPGYGCLFSVEFDNLDATIAFYDKLNVHKGPHLGAHLTLALPYSMGIYGNDLEWAARYNIRPTQIRISVGLEDAETLLEEFRLAVQAADAYKGGLA
jgi:cystathionine gamma-synthase